MRATEAHFRSLADSLGQLVWVVDEAGRLSYGNLAWQSLTQIPVGASFVESYVPARYLVELHDGKVDAYSEGPGRGSEFVVRLPCLRASAGSRGPLAKTDDSPVPM